MAAEWRVARAGPDTAPARCNTWPGATRAWQRLVLGSGAEPPTCPTPFDLVEHMRRASGRVERNEAARLVSVLLREAGSDPFMTRMLVQVLMPGLVTVAGKLQWGRGGEWEDGNEFFGELLTTAWFVVQEWAGQERPYAVLDLLSAIRCRMRRQLFRFKDLGRRTVPAHVGRGRAVGRRRDGSRRAGSGPRRAPSRRDARRRCPGPLHASRHGLFHGRVGRTHRT